MDGPGAHQGALARFFDQLEASKAGRCAKITHVSADGAQWIDQVVKDRCPSAQRCADPFHVVKWATDALDEARRQAWRKARYTLWKNPQDLTGNQAAKLAWIARTDPRLHRAYLLKEGLRTIFALDHDQTSQALKRWLSWASRCRIPEFVRLGRAVRAHKTRVLASIKHRLSNGRIEYVNTKIRLITRVAYGFRNTDHLISLAMLTLGGHRPTLLERP